MSLTQVPPERLTAILARAETLKQQRLDEDKSKTDFEYFSQFLQIRPKAGSLVPFILNSAQRKVLCAIEEQRVKTGRVRAIILKGRQVGCTTRRRDGLDGTQLPDAGSKGGIANDRRARHARCNHFE